MKFEAEGIIKAMPNKDKIQNKDVLNKSADDLIKILKVFERLEVGPVKLEPKRLIAPYRSVLQWENGTNGAYLQLRGNRI